MSYQRECPSCKNITTFKSIKSYNRAIDSNRNCRKCSIRKNIKGYRDKISTGEIENPFKGKTHSDEVKSLLKKKSTGRKHSEETKLKISKTTKGSLNPMYGRSLYDIWEQKYGKIEADKRLEEFKAKISKATSGKNNPMYGKPSPQGSGNGWSGWYKGIYFRSLLELSFLVNWVDRFNLKIENAECKKYKIQYDSNGSERNYFADWVINEKYLIEIKPKKLWSTPQNKAKSEAAEEYCKENNLIFKIIEPLKIETIQIISLYNTKKLKFSKNYEDRFREEYIYP
jgi:hypothetical protein